MSPAARQKILEAATRHGVTLEDIMGFNRCAKFTTPRFEAYWQLRNALGYSYQKIGVIFNRGHGTIMHGVKKFDAIFKAMSPEELEVSCLVSGREARISQYKALAERGLSFNDAAKEMGANYTTVVSFAKKYGIEFSTDARAPKPFTQHEELRKLAACGLTAKAIGKRLGACSKTISRHAEKAGLRLGEKSDRRSLPKKIRMVTKDEAVWLRHPDGYLHMSGETVTRKRVYAWRNTREKAMHMISASPVDNLTIVSAFS